MAMPCHPRRARRVPAADAFSLIMAVKRLRVGTSIHWSATTIHWAERAGRCLPVTNSPRQAYRDDHLERRRAAEPGRAQYGRRALRDAARHGRPRCPDAWTAIPVRSASAPDIDPRPGVESVRVGLVRA